MNQIDDALALARRLFPSTDPSLLDAPYTQRNQLAEALLSLHGDYLQAIQALKESTDQVCQLNLTLLARDKRLQEIEELCSRLHRRAEEAEEQSQKLRNDLLFLASQKEDQE